MDRRNLGAAVEEIPVAILALKRSLNMLAFLESEIAAAGVTMKLVDVLDALVANRFDIAVSDLWQCCAVIQQVLYNSFAERLGGKSDRAVAADVSMCDKQFRTAYDQYMMASADITDGTGYAALFQKGQKDDKAEN